jgi:predicted O-methyltransferase YrrM
MSNTDYRSDSSRPHLLTTRTHGGVTYRGACPHYPVTRTRYPSNIISKPVYAQGMPTTLQDRRVAAALDRMYAEARQQTQALRDREEKFQRSFPSASAQERADALSAFYLPVTPEAGRLLYSLVRATRPTTIVEFGMSFGISAIHLASAVRDNGSGRVLTTELSAIKIATAKRTFAETGLDDLITVLEGDALSTLADLDGPVAFALLDGWKELYLPVIKLLEPRLSPGVLVVADNTEMAGTPPYLDSVRDVENGYVSVNYLAKDSDTMEISCRV